jgi:hypothetical protein
MQQSPFELQLDYIPLTPADINNSGFGAQWRVLFDTEEYSDLLQVSNYGFSIPAGAIIDSVTFNFSGSFDGEIVHANLLTITVVYTNCN